MDSGNSANRGGLNGSHFGNSLFEKIISLDNLFSAWKEFRCGKRKKIDVQIFEYNLEENLFELHWELKEKIYRHSQYSGFFITDPKLRHIHKACVKDRVVHNAIYRVLNEIFDKRFIFDSYSCRPGKGTHRAVRRMEKFIRALSRNYRQNIFALKCDVKKFFDTIDHGILLTLIQKKIKDERAIWLIREIIGSFEKSQGKGLPIGNVTSQIFANIYLNELDQFVKCSLRIKYYIRYCDDFIILAKSINELKENLKRIKIFLKESLQLFLHSQKFSIRDIFQGIDVLGYVVLPYHTVLRTKTKRRMLGRLNSKNLASYWGLCKHANTYNLWRRVLNTRF